MSKIDRIDRQKIVDLLIQYVKDTHIGSLERYSFHNLQNYAWMDKANGEIKATFKMKIETTIPTIGTPPIEFDTETVIIADYKTIRPHSLSYSGIQNNMYADWMK